MEKLVSVIIPVYNTKPYIEDCLSSVIKQTYKNLEIIVIDDGSKDNSSDECKKFLSDKRIKLITRENRGLSFTRQQGIDMASGEYFCTLDSDDMYESEFVEKMLSTIVETNSDICVCARKDFDDSISRDVLLDHQEKCYVLTKDAISGKVDFLVKELWLADSWNKMYKTEFVRKTGVRFWLDNKYNGTDLSFNHLLLLHCPRYCIINEPLLLHRIVQGSRVHRRNKPLQEGFQIIVEKVLKEARKLEYDEEFFENYGAVYRRVLAMAFNAIICESYNVKELRTRMEKFLDLKQDFEQEHPFLITKKMKPGKTSLGNKIFNLAIEKNSFSIAVVIYLTRMWKRKLGW